MQYFIIQTKVTLKTAASIHKTIRLCSLPLTVCMCSVYGFVSTTSYNKQSSSRTVLLNKIILAVGTVSTPLPVRTPVTTAWRSDIANIRSVSSLIRRLAMDSLLRGPAGRVCRTAPTCCGRSHLTSRGASVVLWSEYTVSEWSTPVM